MIAPRGVLTMSNASRTVPMKRVARATTVTGSSSIAVSVGQSFTLDSVANSSEFSNLFDQYRIVKIRVNWLSQTNAIASRTSDVVGHILTAVDFDDSTGYANEGAILQNTTVQIHQAYESFHIDFQPCVQSETAGSSASKVTPSPWLDCGFNAVPHHGIKYFIPVCPTLNVPAWDVFVEYFFEFRSPR